MLRLSMLMALLGVLTPTVAARADAASEAPAPRCSRYYPGMLVPKGARIEARRKVPLAVSGAVSFGISYGITAGVWASSRMGATYSPPGGETLVPVVGPFIALLRGAGSDEHTAGPQVLLAVSGLFQTASLALFIPGMVKRKYLVYETRAGGRPLRFGLSPSPLGLGLSGTF